MATCSKGQTFGATELVTNTKLHNLVDNATVTEIVNADINASAAIVATKLATIATAGKVSGAALTSLGSIPAAGGTIPAKNGGTGGDLSAATQGTVPYFSATGVQSALAVGTKGKAYTTGGASANPSWEGMTTQGDIEYHNGTTRTALAAGTSGMFLKTLGSGANPAWATMTVGSQLFTSNGTFTSPAGVTTIYVTGAGAGGGGGGGCSGEAYGGGGGSGGGFIYRVPLTVVAETGYAVVIGTGGAGGAIGADGSNGSADTTIAYAGSLTLTISKGIKGIKGAHLTVGTGGIGLGVSKSAVGTAGGGIEVITGGNGADAVAGAGGGGGGTNAGNGGTGGSNGVAGAVGTGYGAGGGGGGGNAAGAAGKNGILLVEW